MIHGIWKHKNAFLYVRLVISDVKNLAKNLGLYWGCSAKCELRDKCIGSLLTTHV